MPSAMNITKNLVSVSQFNKGQSSRIFDRLTETKLEEDYSLLLEAYERLEKHGDEPGVPMADVMSRHGISESDLDEIENVESE